jgi:hypothetical protein
MQAVHRVVIFLHTRRTTAGGPRRRFLSDGTPVSSAELIVGSVLVLFALLGSWYVLWCRSAALALRRDPVPVQGKVLRLWTTTAKGAHHHVRYEYSAPTDNGPLVVRHEAILAEKDYGRLDVGGPVAVTYCRTNPANHLIGSPPLPPYPDCGAVAVPLFILTLLAAAGCINLWAWWAARPWPGAEGG